MSSPRVSVVIPNYNYARFVGEAVHSVLAQSYQDFELIVVDNGSSDDSLEVLSAFGTKIRLIPQENRGQAGSRNRGIEESRGDFIAFLDADDFWMPDKLEKQMPYFDDPEVGLVYCGIAVADKNLAIQKIITPIHRGKVLVEFAKEAGAVVQGGESSAIIRKKCFQECGNFDSTLTISSGWDMYRRIACNYKIEAYPEPLVKYRMHGSNAHARIDIFEKDIFRRLEKMYTDPSSKDVWPLRKRSYGKSYLLLSASYWGIGNHKKALKFLVLAIVIFPEAVLSIMMVLWRRLSNKEQKQVLN